MRILNIVISPRRGRFASIAIIGSFLFEYQKQIKGAVADTLDVRTDSLPEFGAEAIGAKYKGVSGEAMTPSERATVSPMRSSADLTMPETPTDPFDRLGEVSTRLAIALRGVGQALGRLSAANLLLCRSAEERSAALRTVAGDTEFGHARSAAVTADLRKRGIVMRPADLGIDLRSATRDLLGVRRLSNRPLHPPCHHVRHRRLRSRPCRAGGDPSAHAEVDDRHRARRD
jgi:hypothetical protein